MPYKLLHSPSAEKVFLVTTAQRKTPSLQTELSITRSSACCSCLTTLTSVLSVSTARTAAALVSTVIDSTHGTGCSDSACDPTSSVLSMLQNYRHPQTVPPPLARPASYVLRKKSSASAAGASAVRYDDVTQRTGSFTASQIKNRGPRDSRHARQKTIFTRLATVQFERVPGSWRES